MNVTSSSSRIEQIKPAEYENRNWRWLQPSSPGNRLSDSADTVELSPHAQWMNELAQRPGVCMERIEQIRAELAAGTYETQMKLDTAIDRMIDESRIA